jgi:hypothetical protein
MKDEEAKKNKEILVREKQYFYNDENFGMTEKEVE